MRRFAFCFALGLCAAAAALAQAEDGLFSDTSINSVFSKPGGVGQMPQYPPTAPPQGQPGQGQPGQGQPGQPGPNSSNSGTLADKVKSAGFEPRPISELAVQTKVQIDKWSFPVLITSSQQKPEVMLVLSLTAVKDEKQLPSSKLLELLDASREHAPAYFAYSSKRKRIELYRTVEGQSPSPEMLKAEINRLAEIAKNTEKLWNLTTVTAQKPVTAPQAAPQQRQAPAAAAPSLAGKWSAAKSAKEAFALLLTADGKYTLVHVFQGKQTKSTGTFTLSGQQLTMSASDGSKLAGSITSQSQQQFVFAPSNTKVAPLTFKRAS